MIAEKIEGFIHQSRQEKGKKVSGKQGQRKGRQVWRKESRRGNAREKKKGGGEHVLGG